MRILMLLDDAADLEGDVQFEDARGFVLASARRDVQMLAPYLDRTRVQPEVLTLRGGEHTLGAQAHFDLPAGRALIHLLRAHDIELIHAMGPQSMMYAANASHFVGIPTIASWYAAKRPDEQNTLRNLWQRVENRLIRLGIHRVIVPSELARREFAATRYPPDRINVIYPGVEVPDPPMPAAEREALGLPDGPLATMIAPVGPDQGYEVLLDAVPRLLQRVPEAQIAVLGTGPLLDEMQRQAQTHEPPLPITWLGDRADRRAIIRASDIVIVHPRKEGIPRALIEAAAEGKPVVASRLAGVSEIVEQSITGFLVTPGDSRDFAVQIGRVLMQPDSGTHLGATARRRAEQRYSLAVQRETITILYESTIYESR